MKIKNGKAYYFGFLFPSLLAITLVILVPLLFGIYTSFTNSDGYNMTFIGIENYRLMLNDSNFIQSLWVTLQFSVVSVIGINLIGLGLALLVTRKNNRVTTLFRTTYFMPNLIGGLILGFVYLAVYSHSGL